VTLFSASSDLGAFIRANTVAASPPLLPEITLHLASEIVPIWQKSEEELAREGIPPPFWAFAWAGGQALARYVLDHPDLVAGKRVLDFASGCGLVGIAALKAGARACLCADIDPFAAEAARLNAQTNAVSLETTTEDLVGTDNPGWDIVLAGDICYERGPAERISRWLSALAAGVPVLMGDPGRTYMPKTGIEPLADYRVETTTELEDHAVRLTKVWRILPPA